MSRLHIVVEKASDWSAYAPSPDVISARDYLRLPAEVDHGGAQVINLCRSYRYLGIGYYVSLLAEARGQRPVPGVRTLNALRRRVLYRLDIEDLNTRMGTFLPAGGRDTTRLAVLAYFGETGYPELQDLARQLCEAFPCPILRVEFEREHSWQIAALRPVGVHTLTGDQQDAFAAALARFSRRIWRQPRARRSFRFDLAMLVDPDEALPPSDKRALRQFVRAGAALGIDVDTVTRADYGKLAEYDALFLRATTALDNDTYRFAHRAEREGMVVIDDPASILRCTNKIYLHDLLRARRIATPRTEILLREDARQLAALPERLGLPLVLKIPDGSFSRGVSRVDTAEALPAAAAALFQHTALVLAQEYLPTEFDWRIGVLDGRALYACKYYMSRGHWQIYNHAAKGAARYGGYQAVALDDVPPALLRLALRATRPIGKGLYGVDIKETGGRGVVIEVNDNPSIEAGVEDGVLGAGLYHAIMETFLRRMEARRLGRRGC